MNGVTPIPQAALLALLKNANVPMGRAPDLSGSGRFQSELLSFQRAETMTGQITTQLVSGVRPSVFIPDQGTAAACTPSTTQKRSDSRKKSKSGTASHATTPACLLHTGKKSHPNVVPPGRCCSQSFL